MTALIVWQKPVKRPEAWSVAEFAALPETLTLRMIRLRVASPGFRTREVVLVTTLLDAQAYPADALRELYGERWNVESCTSTRSRCRWPWTCCAAKAPK